MPFFSKINNLDLLNINIKFKFIIKTILNNFNTILYKENTVFNYNLPFLLKTLLILFTLYKAAYNTNIIKGYLIRKPFLKLYNKGIIILLIIKNILK